MFASARLARGASPDGEGEECRIRSLIFREGIAIRPLESALNELNFADIALGEGRREGINSRDDRGRIGRQQYFVEIAPSPAAWWNDILATIVGSLRGGRIPSAETAPNLST
jgi:hypothetical protein